MRIVDDLAELVGRARRRAGCGRHDRRRTTACTSGTTRCCGSCASSPTRAGLAAVCVTFDRHPAEVVRPESAPKLLTTPEQKLELLDATGVPRPRVRAALRRGPQPGAGRGLRARGARRRRARAARGRRRRLPLRHGRGGDVALLQRMGAELGFEVLGSGSSRLEAAPGRHHLLVDPHPRAARRRATSRRGRAPRPPARGARHVVEGDRRGRELGYPDRQRRGARAGAACPPTASTRARSSAPTASSAWPRISLGRRPTFYEAADARCSRRTSSTSTATSTARR